MTRPFALLALAAVLGLAIAAAVQARPHRYPVDWAHRYRLEHAHVQRLLHGRRLQAHASVAEPLIALVRAFLCIHAGEGSWQANTGNGYYGGLQQDREFQATYAPRLLINTGTADQWPPAAQLGVALIAYSTGRGFFPWPTTARHCGLIG